MNKSYMLAEVFKNNFSLTDVDKLVKHKQAKYVFKNGHTRLIMDIDSAAEYLNWLDNNR